MTDQENQIIAETVGKMFVIEYNHDIADFKVPATPTKEELKDKIIFYVMRNAGFITVGQVELMIKFIETKITTSMLKGRTLKIGSAFDSPKYQQNTNDQEDTEWDNNDHGYNRK